MLGTNKTRKLLWLFVLSFTLCSRTFVPGSLRSGLALRRFVGRAFDSQPRVVRVKSLSNDDDAASGTDNDLVRLRWSELNTKLNSASTQESQEVIVRQAADLLTECSLKRLRAHLEPAYDIYDIPPGLGQEALTSIFDDYAQFVADFLSESDRPNIVSQAFWSSQMYLRQLQADVPANESVAGAQLLAETTINKAQSSLDAIAAESPDVQDILQRSVLFARQQFTAAVQFGYFLQRCIQRLRLERLLKGDAAPDLTGYISAMAAKDGVELVRIASIEAALAVEQRATKLFGSYEKLLAPLERGGPQSLEELSLEDQECVRLSVEAVAFGSSLYDAEEESANDYALHYTNFGSRNP